MLLLCSALLCFSRPSIPHTACIHARRIDQPTAPTPHRQGGSTAELTLQIASNCQRYLGQEVLMHLTCTHLSAAKIKEALQEVGGWVSGGRNVNTHTHRSHLSNHAIPNQRHPAPLCVLFKCMRRWEQARAAGIENILALRGDPPKGATAWEQCEVRAPHTHNEYTTHTRARRISTLPACLISHPRNFCGALTCTLTTAGRAVVRHRPGAAHQGGAREPLLHRGGRPPRGPPGPAWQPGPRPGRGESSICMFRLRSAPRLPPPDWRTLTTEPTQSPTGGD